MMIQTLPPMHLWVQHGSRIEMHLHLLQLLSPENENSFTRVTLSEYSGSLTTLWTQTLLNKDNGHFSASPVTNYHRAVIKSRGPSPAYYECGPGLLLLENRRKLEPKVTPRCLIPRLLVVFSDNPVLYCKIPKISPSMYKPLQI